MWIVFIAVAVIILTIFLVIANLRMKIPREPWREGPQEGDAVRAYDRTSGWPIFSVERNIIMGELKKQRPRGLLVDIGCGPGHLAARISRYFPGLCVKGLDINEEMIDIAKRRWPPASFNGVDFITGDAQQLPLTESSVDYIVSSLSLHHWTDLKIALREIYRVLKPGGRFLILDLRRDGSYWFYYMLKIGQALFAPKAIRITNGAVGSFWASYTLAELEALLNGTMFDELRVKGQPGWMMVFGRKPGRI
jgi:ubiquinone/menaquinone biosynthesis C-methylase UbiE